MSEAMEGVDSANAWRTETPGCEGWRRTARPDSPAKYFMVSADGHVQEPSDLWATRMAAAYRERGVELRGCPATCEILGDACVAATAADWDAEYLAPILSIRIVDSLDEAIQHINRYGSQHTDAIVTENFTEARRFITEVDSASVMVNASTRFADGFEYGLGAEIGISTDKLHARGPVGLEGLTSEKYVVFGDGHVRT